MSAQFIQSPSAKAQRRRKAVGFLASLASAVGSHPSDAEMQRTQILCSGQVLCSEYMLSGFKLASWGWDAAKCKIMTWNALSRGFSLQHLIN